MAKARETTPTILPVPKPEPPNKNIHTQRSFYSTKKKRKPASIKLARPDTKEKKEIIQSLLNECPSPSLTQSTFSKL